MNIINLTVGDWSDDGHGKTDQFTVNCSHNQYDLEECHAQFEDKYNLSFCDQCRDYENDKLSHEMYNLLDTLGLINDRIVTDNRYIDSQIYAELYMRICSFINPNINYNFTEYSCNMNIGGYGLFE